MHLPSEQIKHVLLSTGYLNTNKEKQICNYQYQQLSN